MFDSQISNTVFS